MRRAVTVMAMTMMTVAAMTVMAVLTIMIVRVMSMRVMILAPAATGRLRLCLLMRAARALVLRHLFWHRPVVPFLTYTLRGYR